MFIQVGGSESSLIYWKNTYKKYDNIIFIKQEQQNTVHKYQLASDILFYGLTRKSPIYWCTSPLKIFEYFACEIPILTTNIGSLKEIINESNNLIYDPEQPNTIQSALEEYFNKTKLIDVKYNYNLALNNNLQTT